MSDYQLPASAVEAAAKSAHARAMRQEAMSFNDAAAADLRAALDELGMEMKEIVYHPVSGPPERRRHFESRWEHLVPGGSRWMPVEKPEASCSCGESAAWHDKRGLQEKP